MAAAGRGAAAAGRCGLGQRALANLMLRSSSRRHPLAVGRAALQVATSAAASADGPHPQPADAPSAVAPPLPPKPMPQPPPLEQLLAAYSLSARQHEQLESYLDYMLEVNQSMNLTAVRDKGEAWQRHVVDSLALLPVIDKHLLLQQQRQAKAAAAAAGPADASTSSSSSSGGALAAQRSGAASTSKAAAAAGSGQRGAPVREAEAPGSSRPPGQLAVIDVGTGAGLPGMVLAVARPEWKITLLDSLRKRCDFLREAASRAGLANVDVVWKRAEEGGQDRQLRQAFDVAVARAVAEARVLSELCLPFVRVGGLWIAAKGPDPQEEVAAAAGAIRQLGGKLLPLELVQSHSPEGQRTALVVVKIAPTPAKLPRPPGTPAKKPL